VAGALSVLQRNLPLPARLVRDGPRVRRDVVQRIVSLQREGAVVAQPLRPVLVARLESLLDEHAAEARAIEEQVSLDAPAIFHDHRVDETGLGVLHDLADLALDAFDSLRLAALSQVTRIQRGVEVIGVIDLRLRGGEELVLPRRLVFEAVVAELVAEARCLRREPHVMEIAEPGALANCAE
jgi:hypothetical protein